MSAEEMTSGYRATLTVHHPDGDVVVYCKKGEGGGIETEKGTRRNPLTGKTRALGGVRTTTNLQVTIDVDLAFYTNVWPKLYQSGGRDRYDFSKVAVDGRGVATGVVMACTGVLGDVPHPEWDINGNDETEIEIESGVDEA